MRRYRVAFVGHVGFTDFYGVGGMQSYVRRLAAGLVDHGFSVDFLIHGANAETEMEPMPGLHVRYFRSFREVTSCLSSEKFDHVVRVWLSRGDRAKHVWYVWTGGAGSRCHFIWFIVPESLFKRALGFVEGLIASRKGRLICVSPRQFDAVRLWRKKAILLLPPVPEGFFVHPDNKPLRWPIRIAFLGVLHPDKGIQETMALFGSLKGDDRYDCAIYATHNPADAQQAEIHRHLLSAEHLKYVPLPQLKWSAEAEREVQDVLERTDIFVQPYRSLQNTVDTPVLVLEAMAAACAMLTTPIGSIPALYGDSPFIIEPTGFVGRARELLCGLSLEELVAERARVRQRVKELGFSARDVALRFVHEVLEAD